MSRTLVYSIFIFGLLLFSCKSTKGTTGSAIKKMKTERIIANHYNKSFNFNTLNAKVKIRYEGEKQSLSPSVTLRMERDKKIWISAKLLGITLAKVLITPENVSYYEKINSTYFQGDFAVISQWLGTELDFDKVQQMLIGQALFNLRDEKYTTAIVDNTYQLRPKKELELFQRLFFIHPNSFKMIEQQLKQPQENRNLSVLYRNYQKVGNQDFPRDIHIEAMDDGKKTIIDIDYRSVDYNAKVSFPFKIPSGYEQVTIE